MNWLNFVGRAFYTQAGFEDEAGRLGASIKASSHIVRTLNWGEKVYVAFGEMRSSRRKTPPRASKVFGYVVVEGIAVFPDHLLDILNIPSTSEFEYRPHDVHRACGDTTFSWAVRLASPTTPREIFEELPSRSVEMFILGRYVPLPPIKLEGAGSHFHLGLQHAAFDTSGPLSLETSPVVRGVLEHRTAPLYSRLSSQLQDVVDPLGPVPGYPQNDVSSAALFEGIR